MSLTSHLRDADSPVRQFLHQRFPNTREVLRESREALAGASTIKPSTRIPYGLIGTALDYRLRYYFAISPSEDLIAWQGAALINATPEIGPALRIAREGGTEDALVAVEPALSGRLLEQFFRGLESTLEETRPVGRRLARTPETRMLRYCIVLALLETIVRAGPTTARASLLFRPAPKTTLDALLAIARDLWLDDLCELSWLFFDRFGDDLSLPARLNPTFEGSHFVGGADADLILDGALIDIKATIKPRLESKWIYQLLGYVLLDFGDRYALHTVALYMARQGLLLRWPLEGLLKTLAGGEGPPLDELRSEFMGLFSDQKDSRRAHRICH